MLKRLSHPLKTSSNTHRPNRGTHRARARSYMGAMPPDRFWPLAALSG